jgi:hypothetical protein
LLAGTLMSLARPGDALERDDIGRNRRGIP